MKRFLSFLTERFKSEHEPILRGIASKERLAYQQGLNIPRTDTETRHAKFCEYGDCDPVSKAILKKLREKYPSARRVLGHYHGKGNHYDRYGETRMSGHSWVEVPEIGHYVDPTHDQYHPDFKGKKPRNVKGLYPDDVVKIGSLKDKYYRKAYKRDDEWTKQVKD